MTQRNSGGWRPGVIPRLQNLLPNMRGALLEVGRYIVEHPTQVVNLSTGELAHLSGVSEAAVVRMSQRLGYRGYRDLQLNLAYDQGEETSVELEEIVDDDDVTALAAKTLAANIQSLTDSHRMLDAHALDQAAQIIAKARRVAVLGQGANFGTAADLHYNLTKLGVNSVFLADPYMQMATASVFGPEDVLITITYTGMNPDLIEAINAAKQYNAATICLTSQIGSHASRLVDVALFTAPKDIVFEGEPFASRMTLMFLADVLFIALVLRISHAKEMLARVQKALEAKRRPYNRRVKENTDSSSTAASS